MVDPETIYNWRRLDDRITTSGQPTEQQLADIRALGVRHIVNLGLHTHEKALPDEAVSVASLGMTYIHIPVNFQNEPECSILGSICRHVPVAISGLILSKALQAASVGSQSCASFCPLSKHHCSGGLGCAWARSMAAAGNMDHIEHLPLGYLPL
jgi:hypothetical protein